MRYCVALMFFAILTAVSGAAQDIPQGSYQQTCRNIRVRGNTLSAKCQTSGGNWVRASLGDADRCVGDITNVEGQLTCNRINAAPEGTYTQSCKNIRVRYGTLSARCKTMNGQWVDSSLQRFNDCQGGIGNFDGQLRCGSGYADGDRAGGDRAGGDRNGGDRGGDGNHDRDRDRGPAPSGSYSQTCRDVQTSGYLLRARCQNSDGRWLDTSLDGYNQCAGEIVNDEGQLQCTRQGGRSVPPGTYSQTCRQIYVRGDNLRAQCETRDGRWVWAQLSDWDSCRSITNLDGQLHCDRD
jgi:hypothetical protein